ncbi:MAG: lysophospholipid acyltransferase family protein [Steroidobacteraceae bacterium]|jgi:KDO2-lipid IV(A) lauroyltransferase|nr:lysophospholipid acyltransferase family protein [Steroidobacteraceae bacterium]
MSFWLRLAGRLPLRVLHAFATLLYWLVFRLGRVRAELVEKQVAASFPELDPAARARIVDAYHRHVADVAMEVVKGFAIRPDELRRRMRLAGLETLREQLAAGQPVLVLAAHVGNWEWLLLALSLELGFPVDAVYKPLKNQSADRAFLYMRSRFGCRLTPAKEIVPLVLGRRREVRAIAMLADQVPRSSPTRVWTRFLNQDTAFYPGPEEIARAVRLPVYFIAVERVARGEYAAEIRHIAAVGPDLDRPKEVTRRYAESLEAQIRRRPGDWLWGHNRWKLKKPLYAK